MTRQEIAAFWSRMGWGWRTFYVLAVAVTAANIIMFVLIQVALWSRP